MPQNGSSFIVIKCEQAIQLPDDDEPTLACRLRGPTCREVFQRGNKGIQTCEICCRGVSIPIQAKNCGRES